MTKRHTSADDGKGGEKVVKSCGKKRRKRMTITELEKSEAARFGGTLGSTRRSVDSKSKAKAKAKQAKAKPAKAKQAKAKPAKAKPAQFKPTKATAKGSVKERVIVRPMKVRRIRTGGKQRSSKKDIGERKKGSRRNLSTRMKNSKP